MNALATRTFFYLNLPGFGVSFPDTFYPLRCCLCVDDHREIVPLEIEQQGVGMAEQLAHGTLASDMYCIIPPHCRVDVIKSNAESQHEAQPV